MLGSRFSWRDRAAGFLCHGGIKRGTSLELIRNGVSTNILSLMQPLVLAVLRGSWSLGSLDGFDRVLDLRLERAGHVGESEAIRKVDCLGIRASGNHLQETVMCQ